MEMNELIAESEDINFIDNPNLDALEWSQKAIAMLRQQQAEIKALKVSNQALKILSDGNNKIIAEYECKYPDFFFMEHDIQGER